MALTNPGDTVLDPFCGSGTTSAVALKHGRNAIGIDCRESQIDLARRRILDECGIDSVVAKLVGGKVACRYPRPKRLLAPTSAGTSPSTST